MNNKEKLGCAKRLIILLSVLCIASFSWAIQPKIIQQNGLCFEICSKKEVFLVGYAPNKPIGDIVLLEYIQYEGEQYRLAGISDGAFMDCDSITSVVLPSSIRSIGICAFMGCVRLSQIHLPDDLTNIGSTTFAGCTGFPVEDGIRYADSFLVEVVDKNRSEYSVREGTKYMGMNSMSNLENLSAISLPSSLQIIGSYAFADCKKLKTVLMPEQIEVIGVGAFCGCTMLEPFTLPKNTKSIGTCAFSLCPCEKEMAQKAADMNLEYRDTPIPL